MISSELHEVSRVSIALVVLQMYINNYMQLITSLFF